MSLSKHLPIFFFLLITLLSALAYAARFDISNNCPFTVWAAAVPGGGRQLNPPYGAPPNTLAEFALNQFQNLDFFDISLVDGFNVPMEFSPTSGGCTNGIRCTADINGQCLAQLKAPGGCNNPCTVFKTNEYCCNSGNCGPTNYSKFFKDRCPSAYSYPKDDATSTFTCTSGTNYKVVFCP
ncbi:hypothetical protein ACB094_10G019100 [Castanea mollissima]